MKNAKNTNRLPGQQGEAVTNPQSNQVMLLQKYINEMQFYPSFSRQVEDSKLAQAIKIKVGMMKYQKSEQDLAPFTFFEINERYLRELINLSNLKGLSNSHKSRKSIQLLNNWEQEIGPLIDYPREVILKGVGKVKITFNYFLVCVVCRLSLTEDLTGFMNLINKSNDEK